MLEQNLAALTAAIVALTETLRGASGLAVTATQPDPAPEAGANKPAGKATKGTPVVTGPSAAEKAAAKPAKVEPAPAAEAPEPDAGMTEKDLTAVIIKTVAATSRDQVIALLTEQFGVKAGKEITDPAERAKARDALEALAAEASVG